MDCIANSRSKYTPSFTVALVQLSHFKDSSSLLHNSKWTTGTRKLHKSHLCQLVTCLDGSWCGNIVLKL